MCDRTVSFDILDGLAEFIVCATYATKGMKMNDVKPESSGASISPAGGNNNNNNNNNSINGNGKTSATAAAAAAAAAATVAANGGEGISAAVAKVLQGYDWTLVPVATK